MIGEAKTGETRKRPGWERPVVVAEACARASDAECTIAPKPAPARTALAVLSGTALLLLAVWVLRRWAAHVTLADLARELHEIGPTQAGFAIGFTALSFVALVGYEYHAVRLARRRLPLRTIALYSFITQSISHAAGFAIFVGATIRYKLYGGRGFTFVDVAKIQLYFTTTFGLAIFALSGIALTMSSQRLAFATGIAPTLWHWLGAALLLAVAAVVLTGAVMHRRYRIFGHVIDLPDTSATLLLIALGISDLLGVAATLHVLMPAELGLSFAETLAIFVTAIALGLVSHVPGSLGVFEGAVVLLLAPSPELAAPLIGALVAFRAIYYMLPLVLGAFAFAVIELARWRSAARPGAPSFARTRAADG